MNGKMYSKTVVIAVIAVLLLIGTVNVLIDPLFQYHKPLFGLEPVITSERYQDAGIAKNFEFDNAVIGNSLSENFVLSELDDALGGKTVKLTASGSHALDWTYILKLLSRRAPQTKTVLCNLDPYIFAASHTELKHYLPDYLYDRFLLNDVNYLFNFTILGYFTLDTLKKNKNGNIPDYDRFEVWDDDVEYGRDVVLKNYKRAEISEDPRDTSDYTENIADNIALLIPYFEKMPDTDFVFFFSPFSMLFWDSQIRSGSVQMQKAGYLKACEMLSEYDNVRLYLWTDDQMFGIMGDLDHYIDEAHYDPEVCSVIARRIKVGQGLLTRENYKEEVDKFFDFIYSFDYDSLFE